MTDLPSMPLYVVDFDGDTGHLSLEEDGAYNRLLRLCWKTPGCSVPDDPDWIARKMRIDRETFDRVVSPLISEFFTRKNRRIWQKRQREEYTYVTNLVAKRRAAGSNGGNAKALKNKQNIGGKANDLPLANPSKALAPTPTPTDLPSEDKKEEEEGARGLYERVLVAVGLNPKGILPTYWLPPGGIVHVEGWRDIRPGLTEDEIVAVAEGSRNGREPPDGPRALDRAMQRFAGQKVAPTLTPIQGGAGPPRPASLSAAEIAATLRKAMPS